MSVRFALRLAGLAFVCGCIGVFVLWKVLDITDHNREAIRVNCVLLSNAIVQSGAGGVSRDPEHPAAKLNALYIRVIERHMTGHERERALGLMADAMKRGALITIPDCERVVRDPSAVQAIPLQAR